jgi:cytochrome c peroxidase
VFYVQGFWDGRASEKFNGVDPFGATGNAAGNAADIDNASLASQAMGPPVSDVESACAGRVFSGPGSLATKLLARPPLQNQLVDPSDSVLGTLSAAPANGLVCDGRPCTYASLIADAFGDALAVEAESRFGRIWGQAIQAYEATLVPDQTPLDRYLAGDAAALRPAEKEGLELFRGKAECSECHAGPELTDASYTFAAARGLMNEDGGDQGFHHIGVRPPAEDLGRAAVGPKGVSFSQSGSPRDRGAFKTPSLRNVKLTAPYFHNGGKATLSEVVIFYGAGVDFPNGPELASHIQPDLFTPAEASLLLAFLTNALTDCRVEKEHAPFDHPSLPLPGGQPLPSVGAAGTGPCP